MFSVKAGTFHTLNVYVTPKFLCWNPKPPCDGVRSPRWLEAFSEPNSFTVVTHWYGTSAFITFHRKSVRPIRLNSSKTETTSPAYGRFSINIHLLVLVEIITATTYWVHTLPGPVLRALYNNPTTIHEIDLSSKHLPPSFEFPSAVMLSRHNRASHSDCLPNCTALFLLPSSWVALSYHIEKVW